MIKNVIRIIVLICVVCSNVLATENTPMEAFIARMKTSAQFAQVSNLWSADNNFDKTDMLQMVERAQPLLLDNTMLAGFMKQKNTAINLVLPGVDGGSYTIELARYDFLSNEFQVHAVAGKADMVADYTPGLYYRGVVAGIPGSVAAFSFFNNEVYGIFSIPGEGNYTIVPNTQAGKYYDSNPHYILYNDNELKIRSKAPGCATDQLPDMDQAASKTTTTLNNNVYNNCTEVRVFEVGDYAMYLAKGSSVTNVTNYLTSLFNNQSTLYRNEGVPIVLKYIQVNTSTDPYQAIATASSSLFLNKFGEVTMNTLHGCDVALLFTTRYGSMGGVAWVKSMCSSYNSSNDYGPYGFCNIDNSVVVNFPTYSWDVMVATHEMGHMVGSPHTHRCCWNPPGTGSTAIDGCYTIEGSCGSPAIPSGGGTIMSYCHLTSSGINFSKGFGPQPGDTIRYFISHKFSASCGVHYNPVTALSTANRTIAANRECTDLTNGLTYYWNDKNTANQTDDTLVLIVNKNGNVIGDLDIAGFTVSTSTTVGYGSGTGSSITFPHGTPGIGGTNIAMRRYWQINATTAPLTAVDVYFPFLLTDTADVDGSVPGVPALSSYKMYKVNNPVDPSPAASFTGATPANFTIYTYAGTPSTTNWSLTTVGTTNFAYMKMTDLKGGGTGFYSYGSNGIGNINTANVGVYVYPNPANDQWYISVSENCGGDMQFRLYSVDGKVVIAQALDKAAVNAINAKDLASGIYFYRIIGGSNVYTGNLIRN